MTASIKVGLREPLRHPKLVWLLWAWYGLLALVPALPAWNWWTGVLGASPEAASVLKGFDLGVFLDVTAGTGINGLGLLADVAVAAAVVAFVSSAFVFGGILEVLTSADDRRSFMHRFFRGGGHFFWRYFRLALIAGACALLAVGVLAGPVARVLARFADTEWEPAGYLFGLGIALAVALVAGLFLLALDYARIRVARDDARGMLRAYVGGLRFVLRNVLTTYGVAMSFVALLVALMLCYVAYETNAPAAGSWGAIALLFLIQQVVVFGRVFLRLALVGAERHFYEAAVPAVVTIATAPREVLVSPVPEPPVRPDQEEIPT